MNINQVLVNAAAHFLNHYTGGRKAFDLFEFYAKDELALSDADAKDFSLNVDLGNAIKNMKTGEDTKRFYLWYYINYMVQKIPDR